MKAETRDILIAVFGGMVLGLIISWLIYGNDGFWLIFNYGF